MRLVEIETFGRGGLAHYVENLSRALSDRGHEVHVLTARRDELAGSSPLTRHGVLARIAPGLEERIPHLLARLVRQGEALLDAFRAARLATRLRPDVVHLHCTNQIAMAYAFWLRVFRQRLLYTAHVVTPHERVALQGFIYRNLYGRCQHVIAHSSFDRRRLGEEFGLDAERVTQIPHGEYSFFDVGTAHDRDAERERLGLAPGDEAALFFGYIREYKGLDLLLDAWPRVLEQRPNARLVIAGDPVNLPDARRAELERRADSLGAITHFGYVPFEDVARYFAAADALVMPYRAISQSGVLFLALALGLPVVATEVGALPEMLTSGESAVLVPPEDTQALARGVVDVLASEDLRARLRARGREVAADHSWESIAEKTEVVLKKMLSATG